jgi:hypothetical protein
VRIFRKLAQLRDVDTTGVADGDALTYDSGTATWVPAAGGGGGGAPTDADYLVGTANGSLSAEIVVGTSPGGELGGTWASPTVDATHSGSSHASVQAAAEATAAAALSAHSADTTGVHGIADTSALLDTGAIGSTVEAHDTDLTAIAGLSPSNDDVLQRKAGAWTNRTPTQLIADLAALGTTFQPLDSDLTAIAALTTTAYGRGLLTLADAAATRALLDLEAGTDFPSLATFNDHSARHEDGGADEISIAGLSGTSAALQSHLDDTADAHDASAISLADVGGNTTETEVEGAIAELYGLVGGGGIPDLQYESRSSNTILGVADKGKTIDVTAAITQTFEADETLGDGWWVILRNATDDGTTVVVLNPDGSETIDGLATVTMYSGEARLILCNGSGGNFNSVLLSGGFALFTADGNFIVPHGITQVTVECIGGGGGGGGGRGAAAGGVRGGGTGGGGGARNRVTTAAAALGSPGDTIAVDVGSGGTSGGGGSSGNGSDGGAGGTTIFGASAIIVNAFGGGGGIGGNNGANVRSGGGGGGLWEAGQLGQDNAGSRGGGGLAAATAGVRGYGGAGGGGSTDGTIVHSEYGGAAGGSNAGSGAFNGVDGNRSVYAGGGGGAGGGLPSANTERAGGAGYIGDPFVSSADGGTNNGQAGTAGVAGNLLLAGGGGGGGAGQDSGTGGAGGAGGAPGGGAGGGGGGTTVGGAGGVGGRGECRVWYS